MVTNSKGKRRPDSVGGATRALFHSLPGVGQRAARRWWDLGLRSLEQAGAELAPGGALAAGGGAEATLEQRFTLVHHADLQEGTSEWFSRFPLFIFRCSLVVPALMFGAAAA